MHSLRIHQAALYLLPFFIPRPWRAVVKKMPWLSVCLCLSANVTNTLGKSSAACHLPGGQSFWLYIKLLFNISLLTLPCSRKQYRLLTIIHWYDQKNLSASFIFSCVIYACFGLDETSSGAHMKSSQMYRDWHSMAILNLLLWCRWLLIILVIQCVLCLENMSEPDFILCLQQCVSLYCLVFLWIAL